MKKLLGVLSLGLACTMMFGCTKPAPKPEPGPDPKDEILVVNDFEEVVVAGQGKIIVDESEVDNGWAYKEGINVMQAISLNQLKALDEALEAKVEEKGVRGLYKKEGVVLGTNDAGWPAKKVENGEAVEVNGSYAVKCAGAAENDDGVMAIDNDLYYTGPGHHGESLTPDTLFVTDNMTGTADSYGLDHNANPIARAAGVYTVILAIYKAPIGENNLVCGLGLLKTADRDPYTPSVTPVTSMTVAGTFNSWGDQAMTQDGNTFSTVIEFAEETGEGDHYQFKVKVNGEWSHNYGGKLFNQDEAADNAYVAGPGKYFVSITLSDAAMADIETSQEVTAASVTAYVDGGDAESVKVDVLGTTTAARTESAVAVTLLDSEDLKIELSNGMWYPPSEQYPDPELRIYQNNTLTFTAKGDVKIVKVEMVAKSAKPATGFGELEGLVIAEDGLSATWTGEVASLVLSASNAQVRLGSLAVTYTK